MRREGAPVYRRRRRGPDYQRFRDSEGRLVKCLHCGKRAVNRPRGLCWPCYYDPEIRYLYPAYRGRNDDDDDSDSSYDRKFAEQLRAHQNLRHPLPAEFTRELPGSEAKIRVLEGRAARGESLWHPDDLRIEVGDFDTESRLVTGRVLGISEHLKLVLGL